MKKIIFVSIFLATFMSCKKDIENNLDINQEQVFKLLKEKYSLVSFSNSVNLVQNKTKFVDIIKIDFHNLNIGELLDFTSCIVYEFSIPELKVIAIPYKYDYNKFQIVKYTEISDQCFNSKSKWIDINFDKKGNGPILLSSSNNTDDIYIINFLNGQIINSTILMNHKSNINLKSFHFCQAEAGESFKDCFSREVDEFCDDFVSTVAFYTNPPIAVLIALMCTC